MRGSRAMREGAVQIWGGRSVKGRGSRQCKGSEVGIAREASTGVVGEQVSSGRSCRQGKAWLLL